MKDKFFSLNINLGLLFSGLVTIFSGLLLQIEYHLGNHRIISTNKQVFGINFHSWSSVHKLSIVILSFFIILHIYLHRKWYNTVFKKKLIAKNKLVITLSVFFLLVAITGYIPWFINFADGEASVRKAFIEVHDKTALILFVFLILHVTKRIRWFKTTFNNLKK